MYSLIWVAFAKRDPEELRLYLGKYLDKIKRKEIDPGSPEWLPIMLHNAGLESKAEEVLKPKPIALGPRPERALWRHVAILLQANRRARQGRLTAGPSVLDELMAGRQQLFVFRDWWTDTCFLLESQVLAETMEITGNLFAAIHVLEDVAGNLQRFRSAYADLYLATRAQLAKLTGSRGV